MNATKEEYLIAIAARREAILADKDALAAKKARSPDYPALAKRSRMVRLRADALLWAVTGDDHGHA